MVPLVTHHLPTGPEPEVKGRGGDKGWSDRRTETRSGSFIVLHSSLYTYAAQPGAVRRYTVPGWVVVKGTVGTV